MRIQILELLSGNVSRAALLAAAAALGGCSSDTGRFSEPMYTGSTPNQRAILGSDGGNGYSGNAYASPSAGRVPDRQWHNVDTTGSIDQSSTSVARTDLAPPAETYSPNVARPVDQTSGMARVASAGGWTSAGGSWVTLRQGETLDTLSGRYGVPVAALRQANDYAPGHTAQPGERVLIPVYHQPTAAVQPAVRSSAAQPTMVMKPGPQPVRQAAAPASNVTGSIPQKAEVPQPPVVSKPVAAAQPQPQGGVRLVGAYTVKKGDTLASIAKTYGVSEQALRERNNLRTSAIAPGQQILLPAGTRLMLKTAQAPAKPGEASVAEAKPAQPVVKPVQTASIRPGVQPVAPKDTSEMDRKAAETIAVAREPSPAEDAAGGAGTFRWPVRGRVISEYGARNNGEKNEGINLAVPEGTSVKAADAGEVIYAGNELKGYGNLVLVRHDNGFVTAYAHASELLVNRGDKVARGQIIARAGATGSVSQPQLHFELRKGQKAVDPKPYLASN